MVGFVSSGANKCIVNLGRGSSNGTPSKLWIGGTPDLMENGPRLRPIMETLAPEHDPGAR